MNFGRIFVFLALPITNSSKCTELHKKYLRNFFQEEFDKPENPFLSSQKRDTVSRKSIRSAIANSGVDGLNPNDSAELSRTIGQSFGGYVHPASGHICETMKGTPTDVFC